MTVETDQTTKTQLPIISYKTLRSFFERLRVASIPPRIDKTIMATMSGAGQSQMMIALRALGLIDRQGTPTESLKAMVDALGGEGYKSELLKVLKSAYPSLFSSEMNLGSTTPGHLKEAFVAIGLQGESARKAMAFFLYAAKDAGIALSPHLAHAKGFRTARVRSSTRRTAGRTSRNGFDHDEDNEEDPADALPSSMRWTQALLSKFPKFDPAWPTETQGKWFQTFEKLMSMQPKEDEQE